VKATEIRHVASGLMVPDVGHVLAEVILKSPGFAPVRVVLVMVSVAVLLVSVSVDVIAELVEPWVTEPKFSDAGRSVAVGSAVPVPERAIVCFPLLVLSLTVSVAERDPRAVGVKVTEIRHVASGLMVPVLGQVLAEVILKSPGFAPVRVVLLMVSVAVLLVSVRVDVIAELVEP
jgi:fructose-specific phosphotransferase system IIC component